MAWQDAKIKVLREYSSREDVVDHEELREVMYKIIQKLEAEHRNNEETISLV